jgi:hypothetical protein
MDGRPIQLQRAASTGRCSLFCLSVSDLQIDRETREVWRAEQPIDLTQREFDLLEVLWVTDIDTYLAVLLTELKSTGLDLTSTPPGSAQVDRPEVAAALERMANLVKSGAFYFPPQRSGARDAVAQMVLDQQIATWGSNEAGEVANLQNRAGSAAPELCGRRGPTSTLPRWFTGPCAQLCDEQRHAAPQRGLGMAVVFEQAARH